MITRGKASGFSVLLSGPVGSSQSGTRGVNIYTQGLDLASVPKTLSQRFSEPAATTWTYTKIKTTSDSGEITEGAGIVVGSQVKLPADGATYTLYYFFPLDEERETLALVIRALATAAALLRAHCWHDVAGDQAGSEPDPAGSTRRGASGRRHVAGTACRTR
jgi:two-component system sensor histidine kinase MtrB